MPACAAGTWRNRSLCEHHKTFQGRTSIGMQGILVHWLERIGIANAAEWAAFFYAGLRILIILAAAWILLGLARRVIRLFRDRRVARDPDPEQVKRIETLARVFRYTATIVISIVAGTLILDALGISIAPVLATAGVAGLAIGFGAQSLIKDYFTGFFLLLEDQIRQGDVVEIAGKAGVVEEVTLRYVRMRDGDGYVHFIPNGEIKLVTNRTRGFSRAVIDVGVAYATDIEQALGVMREVGAALRADPKWTARIPDDVEILGVERLGDSSVVLRCQLRVMPPNERDNIKREFHKRLKKAFDERGIEIPFPQLTVHVPTQK
jgi:small conductance mechanosensitive channel